MQNDYTVVICTQSKMKALDIFITQTWCLVILEIQPFDKDRMEMLRIMRGAKHIPILTLIPLLEKEEKLTLFHTGADVCLEKSTDIEICVAQANALMRIYLESSAGQEENAIITFGTELIINPRYRQAIVDGKQVKLTRKEFDLLYYLARYQRQVFSYRQLYDHVWCYNSIENGNETVRVHMNTLRKKLLSVNKNFIHNVWGVGYCFIPPQIDT